MAWASYKVFVVALHLSCSALTQGGGGKDAADKHKAASQNGNRPIPYFSENGFPSVAGGLPRSKCAS